MNDLFFLHCLRSLCGSTFFSPPYSFRVFLSPMGSFPYLMLAFGDDNLGTAVTGFLGLTMGESCRKGPASHVLVRHYEDRENVSVVVGNRALVVLWIFNGKRCYAEIKLGVNC